MTLGRFLLPMCPIVVPEVLISEIGTTKPTNMKVGDQIQVTISGQNLSGPGGGMISIGQGASMSVPGVIVKDLGTSWLVKLSISIGGADTVEVPK